MKHSPVVMMVRLPDGSAHSLTRKTSKPYAYATARKRGWGQQWSVWWHWSQNAAMDLAAHLKRGALRGDEVVVLPVEAMEST